jgi:hypothetical protein
MVTVVGRPDDGAADPLGPLESDPAERP